MVSVALTGCSVSHGCCKKKTHEETCSSSVLERFTFRMHVTAFGLKNTVVFIYP